MGSQRNKVTTGSVVVPPGSVVVPTGSVVVPPGSVVTTGSVVVPPGSVVTTVSTVRWHLSSRLKTQQLDDGPVFENSVGYSFGIDSAFSHCKTLDLFGVPSKPLDYWDTVFASNRLNFTICDLYSEHCTLGNLTDTGPQIFMTRTLLLQVPDHEVVSSSHGSLMGDA
ncbi:hypothetical protein Tco_1329278 [Tanacetum coccineum]